MTRFIFSVILISFIAACDQKEPTSDNIDQIVRTAKLLTIEPVSEQLYLNYPAIVKSQNLSSLSFEVRGVIRELLVVESQKVNKGDMLAKLDSRDLQAQLKSAKAQFEIANSDFERTEKLISKGAISKSELEKKRSNRDVNKAQLETAEKALQDSVLVAPFAGNIAEISIRAQQAIQAGETAIVILGTGGLEATINLPASIIAHSVRPTNDIESSYLTFSFATEQRIPAKFKEASLNADTSSQTYKVAFTFFSPSNLNVLPGMTATLWFQNPSVNNDDLPKVTIPISSIGINGTQKYVWLVDKSTMIVSKRIITVEDSVGELLTITNGLLIGDTIVAAGISSLSVGTKVRAWSK